MVGAGGFARVRRRGDSCRRLAVRTIQLQIIVVLTIQLLYTQKAFFRAVNWKNFIRIQRRAAEMEKSQVPLLKYI